MNTLPTDDEIRAAHDLYCAVTGQHVTYTMDRRAVWERILVRFGMDDIKLYMKRRKDRVKPGGATVFSLRFSYLFRDLDEMEEEICAVRSTMRKKVYDPGKVVVLQATGRPTEPPQEEAQSAKTILERAKLAGQLGEWKKKAFGH